MSAPGSCFLFSLRLILHHSFQDQLYTIHIHMHLYRFLVFLCFALPLCLVGQRNNAGDFEEGFFWGFKAGATHSSVTEVRSMLIAPIYPVETYQTTDGHRNGGLGAFYLDYRHSYKSYIVGRLELGYAMQGGLFSYQDINGLRYELAMNYDFLTISPLLKVNITTAGPYLVAGLQLGINLNPDALRYTSNDEAAINLQVQESLRTVLKGRSNAAVTAGIGFDITRSGLHLEGRYTLGLTDILETQANNFLFIETRNINSYFQLTVGMPVPFQ